MASVKFNRQSRSGTNPVIFSKQPRSETDLERETRRLQGIPGELLETFRGFGSEEDVQNIFGATRRASSLRRQGIARGLRRSRAGRALGPRSGALNTLLANAFAREDVGLAGQEAGFRERRGNQGLGGLFAVLQFLEARRDRREGREAAEPGILDFLGPLLQIGGAIAGGAAGGPPGAVAGAEAGRRIAQ